MNNNTYPEYPEGGKRVSGGQRSADQLNGGRRRRRKRKQSRALYYVILVILLGVLVFSAVKIISYFKQQADASNAQDEINNNYVTPGNSDSNDNTDGDKTDTPTKDPDPETIDVDFGNLCADYPDVVGYIYSADTMIQQPIQYGKGNEYYLTHDLKGNTNNNGSIFVEQLNSGSFSDNNTIIYGHNMKTGMMFAGLRNYHTDKNYYSAHPYMYIYTPTQNYRLDLYAGFVCNHDDEIYSTALTQEQLQAMAAKSDFKSNIGTPTGRTVTLSTCSYEYNDARYVVIGALNPVD